MRRRPALILALLVSLAAPALAQSVNPRQVEIEAERMEILDAENRAIFSGKVSARRKDVQLTADRVVAYYRAVKQQDGTSKDEVSKLEAEGSIRIVTSKQTITGEWAKMDVKADRLEVGGKVRVVQGQTTLEGQLLKVDLATDRSEMSGGRVKGSFVPQ